MDVSGRPTVPRYSVGTHYRVWWFWLPLILGVICLLIAAALMTVARPLGVFAASAAVGLLIWTVLSHWIIVRGRRWLEYDESGARIVDRNGTFEFQDEQVTDLAEFQVLHHAGGRLTGVSRARKLWIETPHGERRVRLINRVSSDGSDPLDELIDRLGDQLVQRGIRTLAKRGNVDGDGWRLDDQALHFANGKRQASLPVESVAAIETVGQELRIWREGRPRAVVRLRLSGRNTWMLPRLLPNRSDGIRPATRPVAQSATTYPLGRILFERTTGPAVSVLFATLGMVMLGISLIVIFVAIRAVELVGIVLGVLLGCVGIILLICGVRVRRVRFCCHEHGLERVTLSGRQVLKFSEIDVFSFESRRNHSHGRYTGTTYTLVFADRSREQGRGIFFSTTVRNTDEELELLRDRVSEKIARRMAAAYARTNRVQWTTELWFHEDVLEFSRPRRLFFSPKLTVVPYDSITDFEVRDGRFYIWTNYQERAVVSVRTASPNFYPGLILLEGLVNTHVRDPDPEWSSSANMH